MKNKLVVIALLVWLGLLDFHTASAQPVVTTLAASGVTATNAALRGTVNPNGAATTAYFQYGLTTNYGSFSATNTLAATNTPLAMSNLIGSLAPGTTYHFQIVGVNSGGTTLGGDRTFTSSAGTPLVTTLAASGITTNNATLNGVVNPNGAATTAYFRYGLTTNYDSFSATNSLPATNATLLVSNLISSLAPATTYHFQLVSSNSVGASLGADRTFTTAFAAPIVTTLAASGVTATNATLNGTVNPNGDTTTAYFQYGLTTNYGSFSATNTLVATNTTLAVSNLISSLTPLTTYHFRIVGVNNGGTTLGVDRTFTNSPVAPTVTTLAASGVTATNTTLNGTVNPHGAATTAYFQYGLTTNYGSYSATNSLTATNTTLGVSNLIRNLAPDAVYHFRIVGVNSGGTTLGLDRTFTNSLIAPTVTTLAASGVTATNAILNGTVIPNATATTVYFQYGLTTSYGSYSATNILAATNTTLAVSNLISSLASGTTYHFRIVGVNSGGATLGADRTLTTIVPVAVNFNLTGSIVPPVGASQLRFTNLYGLSFTVLFSTNATLPMSNWTVLGSPSESPPGQYQFTDMNPQNVGKPVRFYRVRSP